MEYDAVRRARVIARNIRERGVRRIGEHMIGRCTQRLRQERIDRGADKQTQRLDRRQFSQRFGNRKLPLPIAERAQDFEGLDVHVVAGISPARVQVRRDDLIDARAGTALIDLQFLRQALRQEFVKQLRLPLDLDPEQVPPHDRNDHTLGDGLEQLAPLFRIVTHFSAARLSGTTKNRNGGSHGDRAPRL